MHQVLMDAYLSSAQSFPSHPASPLVAFVMSVVRVNVSACQAVQRSRFFDTLLCLYVCGFNGDAHNDIRMKGSRKSLVEDVCALLVLLCSSHDAQVVVSAHPIFSLWPMDSNSRKMFGDQIPERQIAWRELGFVIVTQRISSLEHFLSTFVSTSLLYPTELEDACTDLNVFTRQVDLEIKSC
jgi:hypothetical protein